VKMVEINIYLVDEKSKCVLASANIKLSPMESKLSLSVIKIGVLGVFRAYAGTSGDNAFISKKNLESWPELKNSGEFADLDTITVTSSSENFPKFQEYLQTLKNPDSLMFVRVQGSNITGLSLHDNWCCEEDSTTPEDVCGSAASRSTDTSATSIEAIPESLDIQQHSDCYDFCLAKGFLMPAPTLKVTIRASRLAKDMHGKSFTMYNIFVKQGTLEWFVEHRYSDFAALNQALLKQPTTETGFISKPLIPRLTTKKILTSKSMSAYTVDKRRIKLGKYLNSLILIEQAMSNRLILSFLGMLNTSRFDVVTSQGVSRNIIHLSKVRTEAKWGDVILFKCANTLSHLQRTVTRSEFDHVGIVVKSVKNPGQLDLLESTGDGVTTFSLTGRLKAYHHHNFVEYMCIRQLKEFHRNEAVLRAVDELVQEVVGLPYGFSPAQVFSKKQKSKSSISGKFSSMMTSSSKKAEKAYMKNLNPNIKSDESKNKSFFCSELVATVLKQMDVIPESLNAEYFWPGCFAKEDEVDTIMKENNLSSYYDEELVIDCRIVEISKATVDPDILRKKKSQVMDSEIILKEAKIDHGDSRSDCSDDSHPEPPQLSNTLKVNSKNEHNQGLERYTTPKSQLVANSFAKLEASSSDDDDEEEDEGGEGNIEDNQDCDNEDENSVENDTSEGPKPPHISNYSTKINSKNELNHGLKSYMQPKSALVAESSSLLQESFDDDDDLIPPIPSLSPRTPRASTEVPSTSGIK